MSTVNGDSSAPVPVEAILEGIGETVRARRKANGMTISDLADRTGLSPAIISQLERGMANPSFTTLAQVAHGLDMPVGSLFAQQATVRSPVVRKSERRDLRMVASKAVGQTGYELLTPDLNGSLEAIWVVTPPGHDTSDTPFTHHGEEFGIVISGRKEVYLDGVCHRLEEGDSITFDSSVPHWFTNVSDETCVALWIITPPTW